MDFGDKTAKLGRCYACRTEVSGKMELAYAAPDASEDGAIVFCPTCCLPNVVVVGDVLSLRRMTDEEMAASRENPAMSAIFAAKVEEARERLRLIGKPTLN